MRRETKKTRSKIQQLRDAMEPGKEYSSIQLGEMAEIKSRHVGAFLDYDIKKGWILKNDGWPRTYRKPTELEAMKRNIDNAIALLARFGYTVTKEAVK